DIEADRDKMKADLTSMTNARDWQEFKALLMKSYCGYASKEDMDRLAIQYDKYKQNQLGTSESDKEKEGVGLIDKKLQDELKWDPALKKPQTTFEDKVQGLNSQ